MNQPNDQALRQVLGEDMPGQLSPNFCFRTLRRVEELARRRARRAEQRLWAVTTALALLLAAGGTAALWIYCGDSLREAFANLGRSLREADWAVPAGLGGIILLLLGLDYRMRRLYFARRRKRPNRG